jgi:hypothetical protein
MYLSCLKTVSLQTDNVWLNIKFTWFFFIYNSDINEHVFANRIDGVMVSVLG